MRCRHRVLSIPFISQSAASCSTAAGAAAIHQNESLEGFVNIEKHAKDLSLVKVCILAGLFFKHDEKDHL